MAGILECAGAGSDRSSGRNDRVWLCVSKSGSLSKPRPIGAATVMMVAAAKAGTTPCTRFPSRSCAPPLPHACRAFRSLICRRRWRRSPRFAARLEGPHVFIKRDDCTGMLMGGNKTRHNEFLLAEALRQSADALVWGAGVQSNNCRQTAAACNKLGLECHLYLTPRHAQRRHPGQSAARSPDGRQGPHRRHADRAGAGRPAAGEGGGAACAPAAGPSSGTASPAGRSRPSAMPCAWRKSSSRCRRIGVEPTHVYAAAAGATGAGLALGKAVLGWPGKVRLLCPIRWPWDTPADLADVANRAAALLGLPHRLGAADIDIRDDYMGPGYGAVTRGRPGGDGPAGAHRGHPARSGIHGQGDGGADRRRPACPARRERSSGVHPHRRHARGIRVSR